MTWLLLCLVEERLLQIKEHNQKQRHMGPGLCEQKGEGREERHPQPRGAAWAILAKRD